MRTSIAVMFLVLGTTLAARAAEPGDYYTDRAILQELHEIRGLLERLARDVAALKEEAKPAEKKAAAPAFPRTGAFSSSGPNLEKLGSILFPDDPTEDKVRRYIRDVITASPQQNMFTDSDPQVSMLTTVGTEYLPLLIEALGRTGGMNDYHLVRAIVDLADERSKALILDALPIHHELIQAVIRNGWEHDARDILVDELRSAHQYLPTEWLKAVAALEDPETYPLLREFFIEGRNRHSSFEAIRHLPIEDMEEAVAEAWRRSRYEHAYEREGMARIAVEYGHMDALEALIEGLSVDDESGAWRARENRAAILRVVDFRGSNAALADWFEQNRERLVFDEDAREFRVAE